MPKMSSLNFLLGPASVDGGVFGPEHRVQRGGGGEEVLPQEEAGSD